MVIVPLALAGVWRPGGQLAAWLNQHDPTGTMWTDYHSSSQWHYFTRPHRPVPILTNTWAYPPATLDRFLLYCGIRPRGQWLRFEQVDAQRRQAIRDFGLEIAALRWDSARQMTGCFVLDPSWALVHLGGLHLVFLRTGPDAPNGELAARHVITPSSLMASGYMDRVATLDPVAAVAFFRAGRCLYELGRYIYPVEARRASRDRTGGPERKPGSRPRSSCCAGPWTATAAATTRG